MSRQLYAIDIHKFLTVDDIDAYKFLSRMVEFLDRKTAKTASSEAGECRL